MPRRRAGVHFQRRRAQSSRGGTSAQLPRGDNRNLEQRFNRLPLNAKLRIISNTLLYSRVYILDDRSIRRVSPPSPVDESDASTVVASPEHEVTSPVISFDVESSSIVVEPEISSYVTDSPAADSPSVAESAHN